MNSNQSTSWFKTITPIAAIFAFRMLGLFMLIPVFTLYASKLTDATPLLIGTALGAYGLTQGLLQIPFGLLSDKFGRKPLITVGLILFLIGSLLGAVSTSIYTMILARLFQGMGAVGSVLIALSADLTTDEDRTKAMATIGLTIGVSFSLAMVVSPYITHLWGLAGIFYTTACLALMGIGMLWLVIPTPTQQTFHLDSETRPTYIHEVISNKELLLLDFGIFCQHFILTSTFFVLPLILKQELSLSIADKSLCFYLPLMVLAFLLMIPLIILAEKYKKMPIVFLGSVAIIAITQVLLGIAHDTFLQLSVFMLLYFIAFNVMEAILPSLISRKAPIYCKGTAMGVYSSSQFLGIFAGGLVAGILFHWVSYTGLFWGNALLATIWSLLSTKLNLSVSVKTIMFGCPSDKLTVDMLTDVKRFPGVNEVAFSKEESVMYLKVERALFDSEQFKAKFVPVNQG